MSGAPAAEAYVRIDPRLLEEAIFHALHGRGGRAEYHGERARPYSIPDPERREIEFRALDAVWFARLGLGHPLLEALAEHPRVRAGTCACVVGWARRPADEGVDLHVIPGKGPGCATLVARLRPESFSEPDRLLALLRRELLHVDDILDPDFGYEPRLDSEEVDPARRKLLLDRYAALWNVSVEGRLNRRGRSAPAAESHYRRAFEGAFPMLDGRAPELFERFWADPSPTHAMIAAFALDPRGALGFQAATHCEEGR